MVQVAQEKADLTEQSEILAKQIEKEEEELASLEQAMKLMKNSNDSYRVTNCRSGELHTDQTIELEESIKNKLTAQKQLKRRRANGPDGIPLEIFKELADEQMTPVEELFKDWWENESITMEDLKARVVHIYKKGNTNK